MMDHFDLASWISTHRPGYLHKSPPLVVIKECHCLLHIPDNLCPQIPSVNVPVNDLVDIITFPSALNIPILATMANVFSANPPDVNYSIIGMLPLSPLDYTNHLFRAFEDA